MISPAESLLKYESVSISRSTDMRSPKGRPSRVSPQQPADSHPATPPTKPKSATTGGPKHEDKEIMNIIFPPREWMEGDQLRVQRVSTAPSTRVDVIHLEEQLDIELQQRQARETAICPVRRELYNQCFDELMRQVTINCAERGLLLLRVRDELRMTMAAYRTLYESGTAFGMRKALQAEAGKADREKREENRMLEKQLDQQPAECDAGEREENEKKCAEEIQFLKRSNQQLKTQLLEIIKPKK